MTFHRRRLPHHHPEGRVLFVTWTLEGAIPPSRYPPPGNPNAGAAFAWMDRYLDTTRYSAAFMRDHRVASAVTQALLTGRELEHYELHAYVVMPNHVHILITPLIPVVRLIGSLKGSSAREANRILGRTGRTFWQSEYYDHCVRDEAGFNRIRAYIEHNPVRAGLAERPEDYHWSSAGAAWQCENLRPG